ncbi:MAG: ATP-binding protein [Acidobacteriota bacterium]
MQASPHPSCPKCGGTGWVPLADEVSSAVTRCECYRSSQLERRLASANIPARYCHSRLGNFFFTKGMDRSLDEAKLVAENFLEAFPRVTYGLLFAGPAGVGKTHLAVALLHALIDQHGVAGRFADYRDLLRSIQDSYNPVSQTSELEILRPVLSAEVLLLDELGTRRPSNWVLDTVTHILNDRYSNQRLTLITTNYPDEPEAWSDQTLKDRVGTYAHSRLYEMCRLVSMQGDDFRKQLSASDRPLATSV